MKKINWNVVMEVLQIIGLAIGGLLLAVLLVWMINDAPCSFYAKFTVQNIPGRCIAELIGSR